MSLKDKSCRRHRRKPWPRPGTGRGAGGARRQGDGRRPRRRCARYRPRPAGRRHDLRRRYGRGRRLPHPCRCPPRHPGVERRRDAADGTVGPAELGGFHRALGARRQGRALLAAGGAQPAVEAGKPGPGGIERRGSERIADVGRLCRRQAHALVHGQIRQRRLEAEEPRHPLPGDRPAADGRAARASAMRAPTPTRERWA